MQNNRQKTPESKRLPYTCQSEMNIVLVHIEKYTKLKSPSENPAGLEGDPFWPESICILKNQ